MSFPLSSTTISAVDFRKHLTKVTALCGSFSVWRLHWLWLSQGTVEDIQHKNKARQLSSKPGWNFLDIHRFLWAPMEEVAHRRKTPARSFMATFSTRPLGPMKQAGGWLTPSWSYSAEDHKTCLVYGLGPAVPWMQALHFSPPQLNTSKQTAWGQESAGCARLLPFEDGWEGTKFTSNYCKILM